MESYCLASRVVYPESYFRVLLPLSLILPIAANRLNLTSDAGSPLLQKESVDEESPPEAREARSDQNRHRYVSLGGRPPGGISGKGKQNK